VSLWLFVGVIAGVSLAAWRRWPVPVLVLGVLALAVDGLFVRELGSGCASPATARFAAGSVALTSLLVWVVGYALAIRGGIAPALNAAAGLIGALQLGFLLAAVLEWPVLAGFLGGQALCPGGASTLPQWCGWE